MIDAIIRTTRSGEASSNPLSNWDNDDILLTEEAQKIVAAAFPRAFRVLDWVALREEFKKHEFSANRFKKKVNLHGVTGALLSTVGASLLAIAPLFPGGTVQSAIIVVGCSFVLVGAIMGLWHLFGHSGRANWMLNRLWTERLRQFYFQYPINNFDETIAAMGDDGELKKYQSLRDGALRAFRADIETNISSRGFIEAIRWLADDYDDTRVWGQSVWQINRVLPSSVMIDDHREIFECLSRGRIGIQEVYAQRNLKRGLSSAGEMAHRIITFGNIATLVFVVSLTVAGMWILLGSERGSLPSDILIAVSGIAAAWGLYFRLVDQGMGHSLDTERYELYAEQIELVRQQFNGAADNVHDKIVALRRLETFTYREMRQFLRTHLRSRFLG